VNHEELSELLRSLPRENASNGFTTRVMAHARERRAERPRWRVAAATALVAIIVMVSVAGVRLAERRDERLRVEKMRAEQVQLRNELELLKEMSKKTDPVVYVGSSGSYDVVLDVSKQKRVTSTSVPVVFVADDGSL
jgi:hypothetical protein